MSKIVCYGEVLWDVFPSHKKIGGAPLNVALRLKSFGNDVTIISSVGNDINGKELIEYIESKKLDCNFIQVNDTYKTSHVKVMLDDKGSASYSIEKPCAWDFIKSTDSAKTLIQNSDVFIHGSLVARKNHSKATLLEFLEISSFNVFDVNLRPPHYDLKTLKILMSKADLIKFNDEELLEICTRWNFISNDLTENIEFISNKTNTNQICVTLGEKGALFYRDKQFYKSQGYKVNVEDTVGAGDSFLAALVHGLINKRSSQEILSKACAVGALVASKKGANEIIETTEIKKLMN